MTSGSASAWASERTSSRAGGEVGGDPGLVAALVGRRADPDRDLGDHPEHALRAERELAQRRARRRCAGVASVRSSPPGVDHRQRGDELVEAPVARRRLPGRAGRGEAADGRVLERLREVAGGEAPRASAARPRGRAARARASRSARPGRRRPRACRRRSSAITRLVLAAPAARPLRRRWCRRRTGPPRPPRATQTSSSAATSRGVAGHDHGVRGRLRARRVRSRTRSG